MAVWQELPFKRLEMLKLLSASFAASFVQFSFKLGTITDFCMLIFLHQVNF